MALPPKAPEPLIEEEVLSPDRVEALFDLGIRSTLLERGVLVPEKQGSIRVRFVGVIVAGSHTFEIRPKIFVDLQSGGPLVMRHVIRALRRYARWKPNLRDEAPFLDASSAHIDLNALAIADWILRDYLTFGIYRRLRAREEVNGAGQIAWARTIERVAAVQVAGRSLYLDVLTRSPARDREHFVSRLHRQIVETSSRHFGHLLGYAPFNLDHEPFEPFTEMPPQSLAEPQIRQEMREAFSDRATQLLPMLLSWIKAFQQASSLNIALYGTTAFYAVWEQACAQALGNERDEWQKHIPKPTWRSAAGHVQESDTFQPDIITRIHDGSAQYLLIADAKYYRLTMPPALRGQPGVNDVAKQLWYQRCLTSAAAEAGLATTYNIFVVPGPERQEHFWADGQVDLAGLPETTVKVKRLAGLEALRRYADGDPLDPERVRSVVCTP